MDESLIDTIQRGVPVYDVKHLAQEIKNQQLKIAILTVPREYAQDITNKLVDAGIQGILNFTPRRLTVPENVRVHSVDLTNELQTLIYFTRYYQDGED